MKSAACLLRRRLPSQEGGNRRKAGDKSAGKFPQRKRMPSGPTLRRARPPGTPSGHGTKAVAITDRNPKQQATGRARRRARSRDHRLGVATHRAGVPHRGGKVASMARQRPPGGLQGRCRIASFFASRGNKSAIKVPMIEAALLNSKASRVAHLPHARAKGGLQGAEAPIGGSTASGISVVVRTVAPARVCQRGHEEAVEPAVPGREPSHRRTERQISSKLAACRAGAIGGSSGPTVHRLPA